MIDGKKIVKVSPYLTDNNIEYGGNGGVFFL